MKKQNEFKLTVESKSINEGFVRVVASSFIAQLDPTLDELTDFKTAVSEAVTNCIVHAYKETCGKIYINGVIFDDNTVRLTVRDRGCGIADISKATQPLYTTGGSDRAGLGFTVMESFCDNIKVRSSLGKGTSVTLTKKIEGRAKW